MDLNKLKEIIKKQCIAENSDYIWLPEMEWLDENETSERKRVWSGTFNLQELELFAIDGYGDMYAWFTEGENKKEIVFIATDSETGGTFFAPNLAAAIFRRIMEFAGGLYTEFCTDEEKAAMSDSDDYISESEAIGILRSCRLAFGDYFEDKWNEILDEMIEGGFNEQNCFIDESRVSPQELAHLLNYNKIGMPVDLTK